MHKGSTLRLPPKTSSVLQRDKSNYPCVPTLFLYTSKPRHPKKKRIPISKKLDGGNCECCVPGMNNVPCPSYSHDSPLLLQRTRAISESKLS